MNRGLKPMPVSQFLQQMTNAETYMLAVNKYLLQAGFIIEGPMHDCPVRPPVCMDYQTGNEAFIRAHRLARKAMDAKESS